MLEHVNSIEVFYYKNVMMNNWTRAFNENLSGFNLYSDGINQFKRLPTKYMIKPILI